MSDCCDYNAEKSLFKDEYSNLVRLQYIAITIQIVCNNLKGLGEIGCHYKNYFTKTLNAIHSTLYKYSISK